MRHKRRRVRLTRATRAQAGWWSGWGVASAGVYLAVGLAAALITAGVVIAGTFLLLYDVDEPE